MHSTSPSAPDPPARTWTIELPYSAVPLSANGSRGNYYARARKVKQVRAVTALHARRLAIPALGRCAIELHYTPRDRRRRDPFNLTPTLKACEDGIVDAGVVPDDVPEFSEPTVPVIDPPSGTVGRLYLVIRELPAVTP